MSKKASQPETSPQPGVGVDFLVRTMIEREATGKRRIRPKNVDDLLQSTMQDESDDPDFDYRSEDSASDITVEESEEGSDHSENEEDGDKKGDDDSDESDDEDYQEKEEPSSSDDNAESEDSSDSSADESDSDSDGAEVAKKSALRETLQKLNETNDFLTKRPTKKKRKKKPGDKQSLKSTKSSGKKSAADSKNAKSKSSKSKPSESTSKSNKVSKKKKVVVVKKTTISKKLKKRKKVKREEERTKKRSVSRLLQEASVNQKENRKEIGDTKPICSFCLGDKSDDSNEIVECDSCGISVHEVCYGLFFSDTASNASGSGSSSCTEPWFCDVCKSGSENINCELCPVEGGLFKESTAGRWIHLVCAMYTQGVSLHNDSSINLYDIPYSRWGAHNCFACESERQAQTGIVISCDAGMCKTYFHATCAQKHGLLSDPNQVDFSEADPYYVSCKMHTNRETMKRRVKQFNTLQEQLRIKAERKGLEGLPSGANADQARIFRKLNKAREKTAKKRTEYLKSLENVPSQGSIPEQTGGVAQNLPTTWTNGTKKQRLLHTAAKFSNDFLRKTERLGDDLVALELEVKNEKIISNVKRKWNVQPAMSVEFSAYYGDRESRIKTMTEQCHKSLEENRILLDKEISLKDSWETHDVNRMAMQEETEDVSKKLESLASILQSVCPGDKKLSTKLQALVRPKELFGGRRKSPSMSRSDRKSPTPRRSSISKKSLKGRLQSPSPSRAGKITIAVCDTCSKSDNQHLITRCDKCRKHYHLRCLDPPLTRMPKRNRLCGWMCSDCCDPESEDDDQVDTEAPRTLRGRTKIHKPRKYRGSDESEDESSSKPPAESDAKPVTKKAKSLTTSFSSPEATSSTDLLPLNTSKQKNSSSVDRRRRSGSATMALSSALPDINAIVNGPTIKFSPVSSKKAGKGKTGQQQQQAESSTALVAVDVQLQDVKPKTTKSKKSTTPKVPKQQNQEEVGTTKKKSAKRKSSDGPLTTFKVNGLNDASIPNLDNSDTVVPKQKRSKKKKVDTSAIAVKEEVIQNEAAQVNQSASNPDIIKVVKPKKPRKKKEQKVESESSSSVSPKQENSVVVKVGKVKKPRKKKDLNVNGVIHAESVVVSPSKVVEKKGRKKAKPSNNQIINFAHNPVVPTMGETIASSMELVTSQVLVSKVKNGALKTSKKRKNSALLQSASTAPGNNAAFTTDSVPEVKEKSVPPKKRKRVSSTAQLQMSVQANKSIDNIIEAVSSGNFSEAVVENGERALSLNGPSTIIEGVNTNKHFQ